MSSSSPSSSSSSGGGGAFRKITALLEPDQGELARYRRTFDQYAKVEVDGSRSVSCLFILSALGLSLRWRRTRDKEGGGSTRDFGLSYGLAAGLEKAACGREMGSPLVPHLK